MKLSGNKILITGGASGIGFGFAECFVKEGNTVIICGRREETLKDAQQKIPSLLTYACDISTEAGRKQLYAWIQKEHPDLNVLMNNAGIQNWMKVSDENFFERAKQELAINVEAPLQLTHLFINLKSLRTIMNVTSGLSFVPLIKVPVYCATKAFFHSFTLSLRTLLKEKNIEVVEVIPPALNTDLGGKGLHDHAPPVKDFIESVFKQLSEGKTELTFGMSEGVSKASPQDLAQTFARMNQLAN